MSRREAIGLGLTLVGGTALGCKGFEQPSGFDPIDLIRINARPGTSAGPITSGQHTLDVGSREALLHVPANYDHLAPPLPLALLLHGAGGTAQQPINLFRDLADSAGLILVSAKSLGPTWDGIRGEYAEDVPLLDDALEAAFALVNADQARIAIQGFSDGASYALQLGRANGDLFKRVVSNSAGLLLFTTGIQRPRFFVSHGNQDEIVNIQTARNIAAQLTQEYEVSFHEFAGGHTIPPLIAQNAVAFLTAAA